MMRVRPLAFRSALPARVTCLRYFQREAQEKAAEATGQEHDASDSAKVRLHRRPVGFPPRATRPEESAFPGHPNPHQKKIHS